MSPKRYMYKRKKVIVFGYEGKNNKTETLYFQHFKPADDDFILKPVSCGNTDPLNMLASIKQKRKSFDYKPKEDRTFLFIDVDCNKEKLEEVLELRKKLPKDIAIILSSPTFEIWFLNHFTYTTRAFRSTDELIKELEKYIPGYEKSKDYYNTLFPLFDAAIKNGKSQHLVKNDDCFSEVYQLFTDAVLKK